MPYLTPLTTPTNSKCWRVSIPVDERMLGAFLGQFWELIKEVNHEQTDGITVSETVALWTDIYEAFSVGQYCMIGSLIHYVSINPPDGVLECDGSGHLRVDYPELYSILPPSLIIDADNFNVPLLQDVFMLGAGTNYAPETTGGEVDHTLTTGELPPHTHNSNYPSFTLSIKTVGVPNIESGSNPPIVVPTSSVGSDEAHNNMPPFTAYKIGLIAR